jgi:ribosomal protein S27AE
MADDKKLTFKIHKEDTKELINPKWRKAEVENAECPNCHQVMVVVFGHKQMLYAYCGRCQQYFVGEE